MPDNKIPTFVINLKKRADRKAHILKEFEHRAEFDVHIMDAQEEVIGAVGLWKTIQSILRNRDIEKADFILLCEDDHQFTNDYSSEILYKRIEEARKMGADVLCGGVSSFQSAFPVSDGLFWVEQFCGMQFTVLFRRFYEPLLAAGFYAHDNADLKISALSANKYFVYPFISTQREFGYSDVTTKNAIQGIVDELFNKSAASVQILKYVADFYRNQPKISDLKYVLDETSGDLEKLTIPTYVINLPERADRRAHIQKQFADKPEFDITIIEACRQEKGALGLWHSIRKIITIAIENDDDVVILCEDDHVFTPGYSRRQLLQNILLAGPQNIDIILGGVSGFDKALAIPGNRFWLNSFFGTQFVILFRPLFKALLDEPFDDTVTADGMFTTVASNKIVLFPFISTQKGFGYSDVNALNNNSTYVEGLFEQATGRLDAIRRKYDSTP